MPDPAEGKMVVQDPPGGTPTPEGTPAPEGEGKEQKPVVEATEILRINKEDRQLTRDEILAAASKQLAGADLLKENAEAVKLAADIKAIRETKDVDAFRRVAAMLGGDPGQIELSIQKAREAQAEAAAGSPAPEGKPEGTATPEGEGTVPATEAELVAAVVKELKGQSVGLENFDPRLRGVIMNLAETQMSSVVEKALDSDQILGTIMKGGNDGLRNAVREMAFEEVKRRASAGSDVLAGRGIQDALQAVRAKLTQLGVGGSGSSTSPTGLGPVPGGSGTLHPSDQPVKRPAGGMSDPGYAAYLTDQIQRELVKGDQS